MIFDKWKSMTMQLLADECKYSKGICTTALIAEAFDGFSYNEDRQYKAYAVYDAELPEDLTKLFQISRGIV